jgi:hypothetical protein
MIMLKIDSELNTNIGAYQILHPLTKNGNFSVYKQRFIKFYAYDRRAPIPKVAINEFSSCIFHLLIYVSKLLNMCLMRTHFSDGQIDA